MNTHAARWPTPSGFQAGNGPDGNEFSKTARAWPTPNAAGGTGYMSGSNRDHWRPTLETAAKAWPMPAEALVGPYAENLYPTPSATAYGSSQNEGSVPHDRPSRGTLSLDAWARRHGPSPWPAGTWSTPCAGTNRKSQRAMERSTDNGRRTGGGQSSPPGLEQQAEIMLADLSTSLLGPPTGTDGPSFSPPDPTSPRLYLNPEFTGWLMGFPEGWTCCCGARAAASTSYAPSGTR